MGRKKERKFLVIDDTWRKCTFTPPNFIMQFDISYEDDICVMVMMVNEESETRSPHAYITIMNNSSEDDRCKSNEDDRDKFEWEIPVSDARTLSKFAKSRIIQKLCYIIPTGQAGYWKVDEYIGEDSGLVTAEYKHKESSYFTKYFTSMDEFPEFDLPYWIGEEVTGDPKYYDVNIAKHKTSFVNRLWKRILRLMS